MQWPDLISTGRIFPETGLDNPHFTGMEAFLLNYLKMTVRHRILQVAFLYNFGMETEQYRNNICFKASNTGTAFSSVFLYLAFIEVYINQRAGTYV